METILFSLVLALLAALVINTYFWVTAPLRALSSWLENLTEEDLIALEVAGEILARLARTDLIERQQAEENTGYGAMVPVPCY